eukprot:11158895-Ditylum_brightwellii.AAC.1
MAPSTPNINVTTSLNVRMTERELFEKVVSLIRGASDENGITATDDDIAVDILTNEDKLRFYALYKRVTVGRLRCDNYESDDDDDDESVDEIDGVYGKKMKDRPAPPSRFNVVAWYKYNAWLQCDDLTKSQARMEYIKFASDEKFYSHPAGRECRRLFDIYCKGKEEKEQKIDSNEVADACEEDGHKEESTGDARNDYITNTKSKGNGTVSNINNENMPTRLSKSDVPSNKKKDDNDDITTIAIPPRKLSTTEKYFEEYINVRSLLPRGKIDISYSDLLFAWYQCFLNFIPSLLPLASTSHIGRLNDYERKIAKAWLSKNLLPTNGSLITSSHRYEERTMRDEVVVGLSVRSLLDLYLSAKSFSTLSEIIMVPAINIQTMVDVMLYHGLRVVPIDIKSKDDGHEDGLTIDMVDVKAVEKSISKRTVAIMV